WNARGRVTQPTSLFHIGGTTALLKAGVPPDIVQKMGRWASDAFLRYWRDLSEIMSAHAELLNDPHINTLASPMQDGQGTAPRIIHTPQKLRETKGRSL
ncbi:hypothetical protein BDV93DRAFT_454069, partial [Ceratobasidium sp. AG-I]